MSSSGGKASSLGAIIGAAVGGIGGIATGALGILKVFFKPYLRRKLIALGFPKLADSVAPEQAVQDIKAEQEAMAVKLATLEKFLAKQKLPRLVRSALLSPPTFCMRGTMSSLSPSPPFILRRAALPTAVIICPPKPRALPAM